MASPVQRRPLPAVLSLVALLLLTGLVWWRVINRSDGHTSHRAAASSCSSTAKAPTRLPAPSSVTVQVLNATSKKGIAGKAQSALGQSGFRTPNAPGNDTKYYNKIKNVAQIRYGPVAKQAATLLAYYLPGATPVATTSKDATVIVSLGLGYKSVASSTAVAAALKKANLTTATPSAAASC